MNSGVNISKALYFEGVVEQRKALEHLLMTDPEIEKKVQKIIGEVLKVVRHNMTQAARAEMKEDPRYAARSVRTMVYRQILGGNVNILRKKRAGQIGNYDKPRKLQPGQRGGNRIERSERSKMLDSYMGSDRGFVLRFLNAGTTARRSRYGNRGSLDSRQWFGQRSQAAMEQASATLAQYIDQLIQQEFNAQ